MKVNISKISLRTYDKNRVFPLDRPSYIVFGLPCALSVSRELIEITAISDCYILKPNNRH